MIKELGMTSGKFKSVFAKRAILASDEPAEFKLQLDESNILVLKFSFTQDSEKKPSFSTEHLDVDNGFGYHFILKNFNNSLGTGLKKPIPLISHNVNGIDKAICLTFFVYKNIDAFPIIDLGLYEEI